MAEPGGVELLHRAAELRDDPAVARDRAQDGIRVVTRWVRRQSGSTSRALRHAGDFVARRTR